MIPLTTLKTQPVSHKTLKTLKKQDFRRFSIDRFAPQPVPNAKCSSIDSSHPPASIYVRFHIISSIYREPKPPWRISRILYKTLSFLINFLFLSMAKHIPICYPKLIEAISIWLDTIHLSFNERKCSHSTVRVLFHDVTTFNSSVCLCQV